VVVEWNAALCSHFAERSEAAPPQAQVRLFAMVHQAMRDAITLFAPTISDRAKQAAASLAASAAAREALAGAIPPDAIAFTAIETRCRAAVPVEVEAAAALKTGQQAGAAVRRRRAADGWPVVVATEQAAARAGASLLRDEPKTGSRPSKDSSGPGLRPSA